MLLVRSAVTIVFVANKQRLWNCKLYDYFKNLHTSLEVQTFYDIVAVMLNPTHMSCDKGTVARGAQQ